MKGGPKHWADVNDQGMLIFKKSEYDKINGNYAHAEFPI